MKKPIVSVVIVNYNGIKLLKAIIESLRKNSFKSYETIIVDNNSDDGSQEFVKKNYKNIKLVENKENLGYSGINSGLKHCNGKYILFLNNDMEIEKNCIKKLVEVLDDDSIGMAAPKLISYYNKNIISGGTWLSRAFYNGHINGGNVSGKRAIPYLGVGMIRKNIVDKYGYLFDPDYFLYGEDVDLGLRIRLLGKKVLFADDAVLYHMHALTAIKHIKPVKMTYLMERNLLISFFKNLPSSMIFLYLPYVLLFRAFAMMKDIIYLNFPSLFARIKAVLWIVFNFHKVLSKRKKTRKHNKVTTRFFAVVFTEKYLYRKKFIV
jgi:GT2 family glycosyltransferase